MRSTAFSSTRSGWAEARRWLGKPTAPRLAETLTGPTATELDAVSHAINRLTFGVRPGDHARVAAMGVEAFIEEQLAPRELADGMCERVIRHEFDSLADPAGTLFPRKGDASDPLQQLFPAMKDRGARVSHLYEFKDKVLLDELTRATVLRAVLSERQLYEVMVQFWTDHFNIDPSKAEAKWLKAADDRDVIRAHALGNFRELLRASAVSPAMLWYLDGRVNRRVKPADKPNENYARELLELHTLGVHGGYTQQDVMDVARCLTGWTVRDKKKFFKGRVEFRAGEHDDGAKRVLGVEIPAGLGGRDGDRRIVCAVGRRYSGDVAGAVCDGGILDSGGARKEVQTALSLCGVGVAGHECGDGCDEAAGGLSGAAGARAVPLRDAGRLSGGGVALAEFAVVAVEFCERARGQRDQGHEHRGGELAGAARRRRSVDGDGVGAGAERRGAWGVSRVGRGAGAVAGVAGLSTLLRKKRDEF